MCTKTTWSLPRFGPGYWKAPKMSGGWENDKRMKPLVNPYETALRELEAARKLEQATQAL